MIPTKKRSIPPDFHQLPDDSLVKRSALVQSPEHPGRITPLQFGKNTLVRLIKEGRFPKPVNVTGGKQGLHIWRVGDVRQWLAQQGAAQSAGGQLQAIRNMAAPQPARQPLTDEQIIEIADKTQTAEPGTDGYILPISFARAIEAAHGIKGVA